jgi:hypothetical protein
VTGGGGGSWSGGAITSPITYDENGYRNVFAAGINGTSYTNPLGSQYVAEVTMTSFGNDPKVIVSNRVPGVNEVDSITHTTYRNGGFYNTSTGYASQSDFNVANSSITYSSNSYGVAEQFTLSANGLQFRGPYQSNTCSFSHSGLTFSDGTTQTTAASGGGMSPPSSSNAVWVYGQWYSANVTSFMDGNYNYYTTLTF